MKTHEKRFYVGIMVSMRIIKNLTCGIFILIQLLSPSLLSSSFGQDRQRTFDRRHVYYTGDMISQQDLLAVEPQRENPQMLNNNDKFQRKMQDIRIKDYDGTFINITSSLQDFKLAENQSMAFVVSKDKLIDPATLPFDATVMEGVFIAKPFDPVAFGAQVQFQLVLLKAFPVVFNTENYQWDGALRVKCTQINQSGNIPPGGIGLKDPLVFNLTVNGRDLGDKVIGVINEEVAALYTLGASEYISDSVAIGMRQKGEAWVLNEKTHVVPYIKVSCDRDAIQGFGIQTAVINISLIGTSMVGPFQVPVKTDKGDLTPKMVTLSGSQPLQTVLLKSEGMGTTKIKADKDGYISTSASVYYRFPWSFLISSLIGAAIGSLIRILLITKKGFSARAFITGVLVGFALATIYWAIGLNFLDFSFNISYMNEAAVIAFSILGGVAGAVKFQKMATG